MNKTNTQTLLELQKVMPFRWRIGSGVGTPKEEGKRKVYDSYRVLPYVDSRDVMDKLDQTVGPQNWSRLHKEVGGTVYCGVSIYLDGKRTEKWDVGSESNIEKEKGLASDSFKRACVNRGVGRFLYTLPSFVISKEESSKHYYDLTKYVRTKFKDQLVKRYEENSLKGDVLEGKYNELWSLPYEEDQVPESIDEAVNLDDRDDLSHNKK